jgi:hypothetical protein
VVVLCLPTGLSEEREFDSRFGTLITFCQQSQTQQASQKLTIKVPKISVYSKRSSLEAMGISDQQTTPKKMKVSQPT